MVFRNEQGFSLVSVMISAGLLGMIAMGTMRLMKTQSRSAKTTEAKFETSQIVNDIRLVLGEKDSCRATFGIISGNPNTGIYDPNDTPAGSIFEIIQVVKTPSGDEERIRFVADPNPETAPQVGSTGVKLLGISLDSSNHGNIDPDSTGSTDLVVELYRGSDVYGAQRVSKRIKLNVLTSDDADGFMIDCSTAGVNSTQNISKHTCESLGGTYVDPSSEPNRVGGADCRDLSINGDTQFNGNVTIEGTSEFAMVSDKTLKTNIQPLQIPLRDLRRLRPVSYDWKSNGKNDIGFIAQNVQEVYPELVSAASNGKLAVRYPLLTAINLAGLQELDRENSRLRRNVEDLVRENTEIKQELFEIKEILCEMRPEIQGCY